MLILVADRTQGVAPKKRVSCTDAIVFETYSLARLVSLVLDHYG